MNDKTESKTRASGSGTGLTRRQFLKDAGLICGATVIAGSPVLNVPKVKKTAKKAAPAATNEATVEVPTTQATGPYTLIVNGREYKLDLKNNWTLVYVLREKLGLTGTKIGCDRGQCAACTVLADGEPVLSCTMLAIQAAQEQKHIETIEGLSDGINLSPLQQAYVDNEAFQCGYCTPGFMMATKALVTKSPNPSYEEIKVAMTGHLCICGTLKWVADVAHGLANP
jgi:xanthine dehydrogenase YagT iron-sulfur-binding subunit